LEGEWPLPTRIISVVAVGYLFSRILYNTGQFIYSKIIQFQTVGFNPQVKNFAFDSFYLNTHSLLFLFVVTYALIIFSILFGRRMADGKWAFSLKMLYFFPVFSVAAPFWLLNALFNTVTRRRPSWR
jgi:hypothetical protein